MSLANFGCRCIFDILSLSFCLPFLICRTGASRRASGSLEGATCLNVEMEAGTIFMHQDLPIRRDVHKEVEVLNMELHEGREVRPSSP